MAAFPANSLGKHLRDTIAAAVAGRTPSTASSLWVHPATTPMVPNPNRWVPLTPSCVAQTHPAHGAYNGCLIAPRLVVTAAHVSVGWPTVNFRFVSATGVICDRVSISRTVIAGTDIAITTLDSPVDAGIIPAKLLPANIDEILVGLNRDPVPAVVVTRSRQASLMSVRSPVTQLSENLYINQGMWATYTGQSLDTPYSAWSVVPTLGDSGSPWMMWVNGEWCLIGCMETSTNVPAMHRYIVEITTIAGSAQVPQVADLSLFTVPAAAAIPDAEPGYPQDPNPPLAQTYGGGMASITVSAANNVSDDATAGGGGLTFNADALTNPGNVYASDNAYATEAALTSAGSGSGDAEGWIYNYGVAAGALDAIPSDATIDGFLVEFEDKITGTGYSLYQTSTSDRISLTQSAAEYGAGYSSGHVGTAQASSGLPGSSDAYRSWGGASNLFGRTWTPAQVKSSNFKIKYAAAWEFLGSGTAGTYSLDHVRITVYYTAAAPSGYPATRGQRFIPHTPGAQRRIGA